MERDPVCGMSVDVEKAKAGVEHGGRTYYFCCGGCAQKFESDPDRYLATTTENKKTGAAAERIAIAPTGTPMMITPVSAKPGVAVLAVIGEGPKEKDPVCGMNVNPAKAAGRVEHARKIYYFCSTPCAERFRNEPGTFLSPPETARTDGGSD